MNLKHLYIHFEKEEHLVKINIQLPPMIPGQYLLSIWVGSHNTDTIDIVKEATMFEVNDSPLLGRSFPYSPDHGYIVPISTVLKS